MASPIARAPQHHGGGRPRPNDGPRQRPVRLCDLSTDDRAVHHCEKLLTLSRGTFSGITYGDHTNDGFFSLWTPKRNGLGHQPHLLERALTASGMSPWYGATGGMSGWAPIKLKPPLKTRSWPLGMRVESYF